VKRLSLLLAVLLSGTVLGQGAMNQGPCKMDGSDCSSGGGSGTVTSVGNGTLGPLFAGNWATATTTPAFSLNLVAQAANCIIAGPTTGADAVPTCRSLVVADVPALAGDSGSGGTAGIAPAPAAGDAAKGLVLLASGAWGARPRVLFAQTATVTFSNTTSETTLVGAGTGSTTLTGGTAYVGQTFRLVSAGTVNGGWTFYSRYKLGSVTLASLNTYPGNSGDVPVVSGVLCTVRTTGASGTLSCQGLIKTASAPTVVVSTGTVTVDLTTDQTWGRTDQWASASSTSSTLTLFTVETY